MKLERERQMEAGPLEKVGCCVLLSPPHFPPTTANLQVARIAITKHEKAYSQTFSSWPPHSGPNILAICPTCLANCTSFAHLLHNLCHLGSYIMECPVARQQPSVTQSNAA